MNRIFYRVERVAQRVLENESLTADLEDDAAQVLLDWGVSCAKRIASGTFDISDDEQADAVMYGQMRALRRMMKAINKWYAKLQDSDEGTGESALEKTLKYASLVYGEKFAHPSAEQQAEILDSQANFKTRPGEFIARLQNLIESPTQG